MSVPLPDSDARLSGRLLTMRILVIALALGVLSFLAVAVIVRVENPNLQASRTGFLTYGALGIAALLVLVQATVPALIATGLRWQLAAGKWPAPGAASTPADDFGKLCALYQTRLLLGAAMLEGGSFLLLIAYLMEGDVVALVGAGILLVLLLAKFPLRSAVEGWLADQQEMLRQERMAG
jgi:hypothetical protein